MHPASPARRSLYTYTVLASILLLAAFLDFYRLAQEGFANLYYAAAVQSMLSSWHNFFFVSFDAGGFVSVDKPPLGLWVQAGSALLFGFNGWSLLLPQALAGVLSVALLYHLVQRVFGRPAGLVAALTLAVTPISVAANRNNTMDSLLVLTSLLAAWAAILAAERGRTRWLLLCAALLGIGFNIKMLQAFLVLPACFLIYFFAASLPWWKRLAGLALAGLVLAVVSLSWAVIVDLTPADQRPYIGSSQNNTVMELIAGHNGAKRLGMLGGLLGLDVGPSRPPGFPAGQPSIGPMPNISPGAAPPGSQPGAGQSPGSGGSAPQPAAPLGPGNPRPLPGANARPGPNNPPAGHRTPPRGPTSETGEPGILRLFNPQLAGQISWFLPIALLGLLAAAWQARLTVPLSQRHLALLFWAAWLLPQVVFFSYAGLFHRYYLEMMAPAIAALAGAGLLAMWADYRSCLASGQARWRGWLLPLALLLAAITQVFILLPFPNWAIWLLPPVAILALLCAAVLISLLLRARNHPPISESPPPSSSTSFTAVHLDPGNPPPASRPPSIVYRLLPVAILALLLAPTAWSLTPVLNGGDTGLPFAGPELIQRPPQPRSPDISRLVAYLQMNHAGEKYILATPGSQSAAPVILATGQPVMALGGFSGSDPILSTDELGAHLAAGEVRFLLLPVPGQPQGPGMPPAAPPGNRPGGGAALVPGAMPGSGAPALAAGAPASDVLRWARQNCHPVPEAEWMPASGIPGIPTPDNPGAAQRLWDCKPPGT